MSKSKRTRLVSSKALMGMKTPCNSAANSLDVNASLEIDNLVEEREILSPEKLAEHLSKASANGGESPIRQMPENIMLEIFGYLCLKDLCRSAGVCRGWNHLVRQKPLWRKVDCSPYRITLSNIRKLVFAYFSNSVRSLSLGGFLMSVKKTECISDSLLDELGKRCPNLEELCISAANLSGVNSARLPPKLTTLKLCRCQYPMYWLSSAFKQSLLVNLQHLDMSGSSGFGVRDIECLTPQPITSLLTLHLAACYRIGKHGAIRIADNCPNLQDLDLTGIPLSNDALQKIGSGLQQLKILRMAKVTNSEMALFDLCHLCPLKLLEELHITDCELFDGDVLVRLVNELPRLRVLTASKKPNMTGDHVKKMKNAFVVSSSEIDDRAVWTLNVYPQDQLKKLAETQYRS